MRQAAFVCGKDVESLAGLDRKQWLAISMPVDGVRFDARMLKLMDSDGDGRIRTPEVLAAVGFLKSRGVDFDSLFTAGDAEREALAECLLHEPTDVVISFGAGNIDACCEQSANNLRSKVTK